ncbi:MAG: caspase family protein [Hyphomicrobiaceae bacterium]
MRRLLATVLVLGVVLVVGLGIQARSTAAETRIALVIGNGAYQNAGVLRNPPNDARRMAEALGKVGFEVMAYENLDQSGMKRAVRDFADKLEAAGRDTVGLVFYAGHGIQVGGINYFIPVNAEIDKESDVAIESVSADDVMAALANARNRLNIVILDACRNNPFARSFRSASRGLARLDAPVGSMVAFSTAPGQVAADGEGDNSPYTAALVDVLEQPSVKIEDVFKRVRERVYESSGGQQVPWESSSILGDFYFSGSAPASEAIPGVSVTPPAASEPEVAVAPAAPASPAFEMRRATAVCARAGNAVTYCADSALKSSSSGTYGPDNLFDGRAETAWVEGASGNGEGQLLTVTFPAARAITGLLVVNGYNKSERLYGRNSRPANVRLLFSNGEERTATLEDRMGRQTFSIDPPITAEVISVEIVSVYPGSKYTDTAISELSFATQEAGNATSAD